MTARERIGSPIAIDGDGAPYIRQDFRSLPSTNG